MLAELLGVPQEDRGKLFEWSNALIAEDDPEYRPSPEVTAQKLASMSEYAVTLWNQRVQRPGDDLISMLVNSRIDGEPMTREQYLGTFVLLVAAGNETTRNSIAGGFLGLTEHPEQKRRLLDDPSLMSSAASEIVRWVSPVMHMRRTALEPAELAFAFDCGQRAVARATAEKPDILILGEMGIGNTTSAAAIAAAMLAISAQEITGLGTGLDAAGRERKARIVDSALAHHGLDQVHPALAEVGKFIDRKKYRLGRMQSEMRTEFKKSAFE